MEKKFEIAERYLPIQDMKKIALVAPTGTGKTKFLNKLIGIDPKESPLISGKGTTTVATQQIVFSNNSDVSELFVKIRSRKIITQYIEENLVEAVKEAKKFFELKSKSENEFRHLIYLKIGKDEATEFPLIYSIKKESELFNSVYNLVLSMARNLIGANVIQDELKEAFEFNRSRDLITSHLYNLIKQEKEKIKNSGFEISSGNEGTDDDFLYIRSSNEKALFSVAKKFTDVSQEMRGELLTPMVELLRLKVSVKNKISGKIFEYGSEICVTDTVGIGQNRGISSELLSYIDTHDYLLLLQTSHQGGWDASLHDYMLTAAASGNIKKMRIVFTHVDIKMQSPMINSDLPEDAWIEVKKFSRDPLDARISSCSKIEISLKDHLNSWFENHIYFIGEFEDNNFFSEMVANEIKKILSSINPEKLSKEVSIVYSQSSLDIQTKIESIKNKEKNEIEVNFFPRLDEKDLNKLIKDFVQEIDTEYKKKHWSVIKALNRRYAEKTSTSYKNLDPISSFSRFSILFIRSQLEKSGVTDLNELDRICSKYFKLILESTKGKIFDEANCEWIKAYEFFGRESTPKRYEHILKLLTNYLSLRKSYNSSISFEKVADVTEISYLNNDLVSSSFDNNFSEEINLSLRLFFKELSNLNDNNEITRLCDFRAMINSSPENYELYNLLISQIKPSNASLVEINQVFRKDFYSYLVRKDPGVWEQFKNNKSDKAYLINLIKFVLKDLSQDQRLIDLIRKIKSSFQRYSKVV